jgi:hypothetical protein
MHCSSWKRHSIGFVERTLASNNALHHVRKLNKTEEMGMNEGCVVPAAPPPAQTEAVTLPPSALPPPVAMEPELADMIMCEYEGDRDNECRFHGLGKAKFKGGHRYRGMFVHGVMHGSGRYKWASGTVFEGEFKQNEVSGFPHLVSKSCNLSRAPDVMRSLFVTARLRRRDRLATSRRDSSFRLALGRMRHRSMERASTRGPMAQRTSARCGRGCARASARSPHRRVSQRTRATG